MPRWGYCFDFQSAIFANRIEDDGEAAVLMLLAADYRHALIPQATCIDAGLRGLFDETVSDQGMGPRHRHAPADPLLRLPPPDRMPKEEKQARLGLG